MSSFTDDAVKVEMELLVKDIEQAYIDSGKKVSGEFAEGLHVDYTPNKAVLEGYGYLAGRVAGKMPPVDVILAWVEARGIQPIEQSMTQTSLAWAIAKKIAKDGTDKANHFKIYETVVTPERIQKILDNVVALNINEFVLNVTAEMRLLTTNI